MHRFIMTYTCAISALLFVALSLAYPAIAQDAAPAVAPTVLPPPAASNPAFQSGGLSASINSVGVDSNNRVTVQIVLQNNTKNRIYLMAFGSNKAATDNGAFGQLSNGDMSGINSCNIYGGSEDSFSSNICLNDEHNGFAKDLNKYSYIEPGEFIAISMRYGFNHPIADATTISFAFRAIARNATGDIDSLSEADAAKAIGRPHTVNINFPLIPLKPRG